MINATKFFVSKVLKKARLASVRCSKIHPTSRVESGTSFVASTMDRYSFCGYDCDIYCAEIGGFTSIANCVVIGGARHPMEWVGMSPVFYAGRDSVKKKFSKHALKTPPKTIVGNDVWIGRSAIILSGVKIGDGAVVGAGSVVTTDVPDYAIFAGNPAKLVRYRFEVATIRGLKDVQWWNLSDARIAELAKYIRDPSEFIKMVRSGCGYESHLESRG